MWSRLSLLCFAGTVAACGTDVGIITSAGGQPDASDEQNLDVIEGTTVAGANTNVLTPNAKRVSLLTVSEAGPVLRLRAYLDGFAGGSGTQPVRGVIYRATGELVCQTEPITVSRGDAARWVELPFTTSCDLSVGDYSIGLHSGGSVAVGRYYYASVPGALSYNADAYGDGPAAQFGSAGTFPKQLSIDAVFNRPPPPVDAGDTGGGSASGGGSAADAGGGSGGSGGGVSGSGGGSTGGPIAAMRFDYEHATADGNASLSGATSIAPWQVIDCAGQLGSGDSGADRAKVVSPGYSDGYGVAPAALSGHRFLRVRYQVGDLRHETSGYNGHGCEVYYGSHSRWAEQLGNEAYYGLAVYFPSDFATPDDWFLLWQFKGSNANHVEGGSPPMALELAGDQIRLTMRGGGAAVQYIATGQKIVRGAWNQLRLHIKWGNSTSNSLTVLDFRTAGSGWRNLVTTNRGNLPVDSTGTGGVYYKTGMYVGPSQSHNEVLYLDGPWRGASQAEVTPFFGP